VFVVQLKFLVGFFQFLFKLGEGGVVLGKVSDLVGRKVSVAFAMTCYSAGLVLSAFLKETG
jgi:MFS family permease